MMLVGLVWSGDWRAFWASSGAVAMPFLGRGNLRMVFLRLLRSVDGVVPGFNWSSNSAILGARESRMTLLGLVWNGDGGILGDELDSLFS